MSERGAWDEGRASAFPRLARMASEAARLNEMHRSGRAPAPAAGAGDDLWPGHSGPAEQATLLASYREALADQERDHASLLVRYREAHDKLQDWAVEEVISGRAAVTEGYTSDELTVLGMEDMQQRIRQLRSFVDLFEAGTTTGRRGFA